MGDAEKLKEMLETQAVVQASEKRILLEYIDKLEEELGAKKDKSKAYISWQASVKVRAELQLENKRLREYADHKKDCDVWNQTVRYFQDGESDICDCGLDALKEGE